MAMYSDADIKSLRARAAMLQEPTKRIEQAGGMIVPYSPIEGFADAFKKGYSGYLSGKADRQEKQKEDSLQETLNQARVAMMGRPSEYDESTGITWNEQKPDPSQLGGILMSNPQTADMGLKLSLQKQQDEKDTALIRNYQAAKLGGYNGSFTDFMMQTKLSGAGADAASLVNGVTDPTAYAVAKGSDTVYNRPSQTLPPTQVQPDVSIGKSTGIPPMDQSQLVDPQFDAQRQQAAVKNQAALSQPAAPLPQTGSVAPLPGIIEANTAKEGKAALAKASGQAIVDTQKELSDLDMFDNQLDQADQVLKTNGMTGQVLSRIADIAKDPNRTDFLSAINSMTLTAKGLLGMPSNNFSDADRNFLQEISGGRFSQKEGYEKVFNRLRELNKQSRSVKLNKINTFTGNMGGEASSQEPAQKVMTVDEWRASRKK